MSHPRWRSSARSCGCAYWAATRRTHARRDVASARRLDVSRVRPRARAALSVLSRRPAEVRVAVILPQRRGAPSMRVTIPSLLTAVSVWWRPATDAVWHIGEARGPQADGGIGQQPGPPSQPHGVMYIRHGQSARRSEFGASSAHVRHGQIPGVDGRGGPLPAGLPGPYARRRPSSVQQKSETMRAPASTQGHGPTKWLPRTLGACSAANQQYVSGSLSVSPFAARSTNAATPRLA
jgi:hypothetical protein